MPSDDLINSIKDNLNGRPGQPMLFGVCKALAKRSGYEPWGFRAAAIVLLLVFTIPTLLAYVVLGLVLDETAERTRGVFQGLFITLREAVDRFLESAKGFTQPH